MEATGRETRPPISVVHKFGGSSLADARAIAHVASVLRARDEPARCVVVSAMKGTTDALVTLAEVVAARVDDPSDRIDALHERHASTARELLGDDAPETVAAIDASFEALRIRCGSVDDRRDEGDAVELRDWIHGRGEVWSATLLAAKLRALDVAAVGLDASEVLVVEPSSVGMQVDWSASADRFDAWRVAHTHGPSPQIVATGFVARLRDGRFATLGRNGSDYSAAIFAALCGADALHIWTDVDGIYSADPNRVPEARRLDALTFKEACELAYFGAKVIHPQALAPAMARGITLRLRSTFAPSDPGTTVGANDRAAADPRAPVKGLSVVHGLALVTVEGAGMVGVPGVAERMFAALHRADISVTMITQASSEHSIGCVMEEARAEHAVQELERAFARELEGGVIQRIWSEPSVSVLAAVGEGMVGTPGVSARLFGALASAGVNVRAIAQGASERSISAAVATADADRALRAAHAGFYLSPQTLSLAVIGPGNVGRALLEQIRAAAPRLHEAHGLDLRLRLVTGTRRGAEAPLGIPWDGWEDAYRGGRRPCPLDEVADRLRDAPWPHAAVIDLSASDEVSDRYAGWLEAGIHVLTPNKRAGSGPAERYRAIRRASERGRALFKFEATVGAGLPIVETVRDLVHTGDDVESVECVLSGTLAWLLNGFDGSVPFSARVAEARDRGFTEPDPRDDLSGMDVARKLVILAREIGIDLELEDVDVRSLVPEAIAGLPLEAALERLDAMDATMAEALENARGRGVLRHVATLAHDGRATVGLRVLPEGHAFAHLRGADNCVQFRTRRYRDNPLVVQGPGAGPEVTAAGVFADLLRLGAHLGARL